MMKTRWRHHRPAQRRGKVRGRMSSAQLTVLSASTAVLQPGSPVKWHSRSLMSSDMQIATVMSKSEKVQNKTRKSNSLCCCLTRVPACSIRRLVFSICFPRIKVMFLRPGAQAQPSRQDSIHPKKHESKALWLRGVVRISAGQTPLFNLTHEYFGLPRVCVCVCVWALLHRAVWCSFESNYSHFCLQLCLLLTLPLNCDVMIQGSHRCGAPCTASQQSPLCGGRDLGSERLSM